MPAGAATRALPTRARRQQPAAVLQCCQPQRPSHTPHSVRPSASASPFAMAAVGPRVAFAAFALVALFVAHADTLRCYTCSTVANKNCGDPFNKSYVPMTDCQSVGVTGTQPKEIPVCKKVKQRVNNGELQTVRSCAWVKPEDPCPPSPSGAYIREEECATCTADLCNGAGVATPPLVLPLLGVAAAAAAAAYSAL